jgi:hypothetical protein
MIFLKKHSGEHGVILAMCDEELIGKVLKSGSIYLDLAKYASFYKGDLLSEKEAADLVDSEEFSSANVIGKRSVEIMISKGIVDKSDVKRVEKVPFVQVYKVEVI